jgi:formate dehydrogenase subunit gamma
MSVFQAWDERRCGEIIAAHAGQAGAAIPILHALQEAFGHVPRAAVPMLAAALNVTRAEVHGIVTFYHDFREAPPGAHVLKLCRAEACQSMGGEELAAETCEQLRVGWHETSADGKITLEPVFCLGLCACAPAAMIDGKVHGRLDPARLRVLVDEMRQ